MAFPSQEASVRRRIGLEESGIRQLAEAKQVQE